MGALELALVLLKNCEACAAAMDESKTNSPTPMYFSATLRAVSDVIRSRSGLDNEGKAVWLDEGSTQNAGCSQLYTHDRPAERFTPASSVENKSASAV